MITTENIIYAPDGRELLHHSIYESEINTQSGLFRVVVGSWPDDSMTGKPVATTELQFDYGAWRPEYFHAADASIMTHPDWVGACQVKPSSQHAWNPINLIWVAPPEIPLKALQADKWTKVKQVQRKAESEGFIWDGSTFDSNAISQQRISNAVQLAALDPTFNITWTLADNTARSLNADDMLAVGRALGDHVASQHDKAQSLRRQIEAASTAGEVEALGW